MLTTMNISLPEPLKEFVCVLDVLREQQRQVASVTLIAEGLASAAPVVAERPKADEDVNEIFL